MSETSRSLSELMQRDDEHFIEDAYRLLLKRKPDPHGYKYYLGRLRSGAPKIQIVDQLFRSKEIQLSSAEKRELYPSLRKYRLSRVPVLGRVIGLFLNLNAEAISFETISTLLSRQGVQFIECAYKTLFKRAPDPSGQSYYLNRLRSGDAKIEILSQLARSREARALAISVPGLKRALFVNRLAKFPLLGRFLKFFLNLEGNTASDRRLRVIEQQVVTADGGPAADFNMVGLKLDRLGTHINRFMENSKPGGSALPILDRYESVYTDTQPLTFFTICSKNFTAYAKTLFDSVRQHHPDAEMYLFLCDDVDADYNVQSLQFPVVSLADLDIPDAKAMSERYNITEFNTAIKPFAFSYLFKKLHKDRVVYVDPDILLTSPMHEVIVEFEKGAECILTPHILEPAENVEVSDIKMLVFGIYNLGFIGLRNTEEVVNIVDWWARRLEHECIIDLPNGLFVDQKWADLLPAYIKRTSILHHRGYNVAYWNLSQRKISLVDGVWFSNDQQLRFVHFSGNKLDDESVFSRHSWSITRENIGDLNYLLDYYRIAVYANGHAEYSKLAYSFNWNGERGINLHTPRPEHEVSGKVQAEISGQEKQVEVLAVRRRNQAVPRIFVTDWSTPRPDQDAGSVTTYFFLKQLVELGYDVTFVPSDLQYLAEYTDAVRKLGIECLHAEDVVSVQEHLKQQGSEYSAFILFRAPIAGLYIADIRKYAPDAKIVLETVDLHYLRDERSARAEGSAEAIEAAAQTKIWELGIIEACDVTIVLSSAEKELLDKELPGADIRTMPLLFLGMEKAADIKFEQRKDIVFIGGFRHTPNVDAMLWFCESIWPLVHKQLPDAKFLIVGSDPPEEVLALAKIPGVNVLGHVKDIDPVFHSVRLSVAPLRYGAGIKGKIATSLGYGVPVIGTSLAFEGMDLVHNVHSMTADDQKSFANTVVEAYSNPVLWNTLSENGFERITQLYSEDSGRLMIKGLMDSLGQKSSDFEFSRFRAMGEYQNHKKAYVENYRQRAETELNLICYDGDCFYVDGYCAVCCDNSTFQVGFMYSYQTTADGKPIPNWREHLNCTKCGYTNRVRLMLHLLQTIVRPQQNTRIYLTEQTTSLYKRLSSKYSNLIGSEFLGDSVPRGSYREDLRNEDVTRLSFSNESFDLIVSCDVLEHVIDDLAAFSECFRCLAPGGMLVFTVPCNLESKENVIRARMKSDGTIEHLINPPEYHGNPVDPENGALCFRYFGWEVIQQLKSVGFTDAYVLSAWSQNLAYLGGEQIVFVATKSY